MTRQKYIRSPSPYLDVTFRTSYTHSLAEVCKNVGTSSFLIYLICLHDCHIYVEHANRCITLHRQLEHGQVRVASTCEVEVVLLYGLTLTI